MGVDYADDSVTEVVRNAERVVVFAGAGMSADMGIPTYWAGKNMLYGGEVGNHGFTAYEHADSVLWLTNPAAQIAYHHERWVNFNLLDPTEPGSPYQTLMGHVTRTGKELFVVTTNVDSFFRRVGVPATQLFEVHGTQAYSQCLPYPEEHGVFPTTLPGVTLCPVCGSSTRPNVVFFNDWTVNTEQLFQQSLRWEQLRETLGEETVILEIGCGVNVPVLRIWSKQLSVSQGVNVVRINPQILDAGNKQLDFDSYHAVLATATDGLNYVFNSEQSS